MLFADPPVPPPAIVLSVHAERHRSCVGARIVIRGSIRGANDLVLGIVGADLHGPHRSRYGRQVVALPDDDGARSVRFGLRLPRVAAPGRYRLTATLRDGNAAVTTPVLARALDPRVLRFAAAGTCARP